MQNDTWFFQPRRQRQAWLRLFCFPYAGGAASTYSQWSSLVPNGVEVWPVQLPGRQNRLSEPPLNSIAAMVEAVGPALTEYLDIPYAFFGHCMGAHLSFELVRWLRRQAAPQPKHLFVSARRAPQLPDPNNHCHHLNDSRFLRAVSNLNGLPKEFVENSELVRLMMPTLRADFEAVETYSYTDEGPLACAISAFGGTEDFSVSSQELLLWREQTSAAFSFHLFAGEHFFVFSHQSEILQVISRQIAS